MTETSSGGEDLTKIADMTKKEYLLNELLNQCPSDSLALDDEDREWLDGQVNPISKLVNKDALETIDILADPETMRQLKRSAKDIKEGRLIDLEEAF